MFGILSFQSFPYLTWCLWVLTGCLLGAEAERMKEHGLRVTYFHIEKKKKKKKDVSSPGWQNENILQINP